MISLSDYINRIQSYSENTKRVRLTALELFEVFLNENKITFTEENAFNVINNFIDYLIKLNKSANTIKIYTDAILNYCDFMGIKIDTHERKILKKRIPPWYPKINYLTKEEVKRLIDNTNKLKYKLIYILMYHYARRLGEVLSLRNSDINLTRKTITFPILKKRVPETATFKLNDQIIELIERYQTIEKKSKLFDITPTMVRMAFKKHCELANIKRSKLHPHILRHSRITHLLMDGWKLEDVAKNIARHSNFQTTYYYYMGLLDKGAIELPEVVF